ncbi:heme oxygenase (staphylobilin-producing) [Paenibacillus cellulosilyticus]|uniref:Heme oxygenase (Staphylobilin-producing) n=1 Tax=Paenibacillus cellulosilyticus TaxID=375489 RepID=A0A2V2Z379_9BACL|nr:heme oxygenase [Paenibacillus cellulosilyticus]PWW03284.1 heme oxygenase (staphylobilin-producing) [Paenibacillus cellulosilyticus]QKS43762.1 heme oxygenase [Paenibacillus cellulosilyticus]
MTAAETNNLTLERGMFKLMNVNAVIPKGKMTAIIGPNGSGKSTLLSLMTGLSDADEGTVTIQGKPLDNYSRSEFARVVSMLPQSKEQMPNITVKEFIEYGRAPYQPFFKQRLSEEDQRIVDWAMRTMRILRHEDRMFHTLSGGEQQKVRIAMALAQRTDLLLLDEPTTYLDIAHQLEVLDALTVLNRQKSTTIVMVLHDLQQAAAYCDHLIAMKDGEIHSAGSPKDILTRQLLREVYEVEAKVSFEGHYPIIIPKRKTIEEETTMLIVTNTSQIVKGSGEKLIERFDRIGQVERMEGFLGLEVLFTQNISEYDEVSIVTRWTSREAFQGWTKSEAFRESHQHRKTPDYILNNKITFQEVRIKRNPITDEDNAQIADTETA